MDAAFYLDREVYECHRWFLIFIHADMGDICIRLPNFGSYAGQNTSFIFDQNFYPAIEAVAEVVCPHHINPAFWLLAALSFCHMAIVDMHDESLIPFQLSYDMVAWNRQAAWSELYDRTFTAVNNDGIMSSWLGQSFSLDLRLIWRFIFTEAENAARYQGCHALSNTDIGMDIIQALAVGFA